MTDLESRLGAARPLLPEAPPVPAAARRAATEAVRVRPRGRMTRRRRGRIGGALALAAVLTAAGLAAAGVPPFDVAPGADRAVDVTDESTVTVATVRDGTQQVVVGPGRGANAGEICVTLANAQGPADVSPVLCRAPGAVDDPGFGYVERPPGGASWGLHVRVPDRSRLSSAIVTEYEVPARGGTVTFESGSRTVSLSFPDLTDLDRRADRDLREYAEGLLRSAREQLDTAQARRRLAALPTEQREAIRLRIYERLDYGQMAARTGTTVAEVRTRMSRALRGAGVEMNGMLP